jgi:hypothetical protein
MPAQLLGNRGAPPPFSSDKRMSPTTSPASPFLFPSSNRNIEYHKAHPLVGCRFSSPIHRLPLSSRPIKCSTTTALLSCIHLTLQFFLLLAETYSAPSTTRHHHHLPVSFPIVSSLCPCIRSSASSISSCCGCW